MRWTACHNTNHLKGRLLSGASDQWEGPPVPLDVRRQRLVAAKSILRAVVGNSGATVGRGGVIAPSTTSADLGATAGAAAVAATVLLSPSMGCTLAQSAPLHPA